MTLVYITGPTGSGKTTIRNELRERGFVAYDTDEDTNSHVNKKTGKIAAYPSDDERSSDWHEEHVYKMDAQRMRDVIDQSRKGQTVFLCGAAFNDLDYINDFDRVVFLLADAKTLEDRILKRKTNDYGKAADELAAIMSTYESVIEKWSSMEKVFILETDTLVEDEVDKIIELAK